LVEDEVLLRMMTVEMLEELGHRVVAEAGTIGAAEPLARNADFDMAVLDINVGGTNIAPIAQNYCRSRAAVHIRQRLRFGGTAAGIPGQAGIAKALLDLSPR